MFESLLGFWDFGTFSISQYEDFSCAVQFSISRKVITPGSLGVFETKSRNISMIQAQWRAPPLMNQESKSTNLAASDLPTLGNTFAVSSQHHPDNLRIPKATLQIYHIFMYMSSCNMSSPEAQTSSPQRPSARTGQPVSRRACDLCRDRKKKVSLVISLQESPETYG